MEDDLEALSELLGRLSKLEDKLANQNKDIAVTVFSEYTQVEDYINKSDNSVFDIILLDRDCKVGGSFHVLNLEKFDKDKVISISSVPEYNEQAKEKGIMRIVHKDYENLDQFADKVIQNVEELVDKVKNIDFIKLKGP